MSLFFALKVRIISLRQWAWDGILAQVVEHSTGNREVRGSDPRNVTFIGLPNDWNHRLLTVASVCSSFYAEVLLTYISRSLSQRNNAYFLSKEQWHPAEDPINTWHSSSSGRALDRQSRGSGFGSPNVTFIGLPNDWNHRLLTVTSVCSSFYAEVLPVKRLMWRLTSEAW